MRRAILAMGRLEVSAAVFLLDTTLRARGRTSTYVPIIRIVASILPPIRPSWSGGRA
jgi:hypothetical protein